MTSSVPIAHVATAVLNRTTDSPITLISGYFTEPVPDTPLVANSNADACPEATRALLQFADDIGCAVGYDREQGGALIQDIFPVQASEHHQVSSSSKAMLGSHTETAFHPHKPRYVLLLCLRGDSQAATTYADVYDIIAHLSDQAIEVLQSNEFVTTIDPSFMSNGEPDATVCVTPLTSIGRSDRSTLERGKGHEPDHGWSLVYDELLMSGTTTRAKRALTELHGAVKASTKLVVLQQGDLLVIDNDRAVHGRTPFTPRYDGTDRWLKRSLVVRALPTRDVVGRVIQTRL